jgi:dTMP kinase
MAWSRGKLIVIEGGDGSGKATQTSLLFNTLKKNGPVTIFEFPRYKQSQYGKLTRRALNGEFGDFLELSPYFSSLPYTLDRVRAKYLILEALKEGHVICDRYTPSNLAHQGAKLTDKERQRFMDFVETGEYQELGLPAPDIVIYLWVPSEISKRLLDKRAKKERLPKDIHESKSEYQESVVKTYLKIAKTRKNWHVIKCFGSEGNLLSKKEIHQKILKVVGIHK